MPQQLQQPAANVIPSPPPFVTTAQQLLQQPVTVTAQSASPSNIPPTNFSPQFTVPAHHVIPNLSSWTFPTAYPTAVVSQPVIQQSLPGNPPLTQNGTVTPVSVPIFPVTRGGTVFYVNPPSVTDIGRVPATPQPTYSAPTIVTATPFVPLQTSAPQQATPQTNLTVQDLAQLLASTKKDHLPEWKLAQYSGDPLQWPEWFGQFKSAIDSAQLTDDVKLTN